MKPSQDIGNSGTKRGVMEATMAVCKLFVMMARNGRKVLGVTPRSGDGWDVSRSLGMDPVHTTKFHVADMLQQSCLLTSADTPPHTPHPASCLINYCVGAKGLQIRDDMAIN